ncbi:MAG: hypothetical protein GYA17_20070 [Chloroflexi bacterium]|nr:hypothetical protein [Chloroflexota bacterium]
MPDRSAWMKGPQLAESRSHSMATLTLGGRCYSYDGIGFVAAKIEAGLRSFRRGV